MKKQTPVLLCTFVCAFLSFHFAKSQLPNLIPYRKADKWGFANSKKKIIIEPVYDSVAPFSEGRAAVMKAKKWGFIDETGKEIVAPSYSRVYDFRQNKMAFVIMAKYAADAWGLVDWNGKVVVEPKYLMISMADHGLFRVKQGSWFGLINEAGIEVVKPIYSRIYDFKEGMAKVELTKQWGFIDSTGKEVVKPKYSYEDAMDFSNGLGVIKENNYNGSSYFFVDKQGQVAHNQRKYVDVTPYVNGYARVTVKTGNDYTTSIVDVNGKPVFNKPDFGYAHLLPNALVITKSSYPPGYKTGVNIMEDYKYMTIKYGVTDRNAVVLKEANYEAVELLDGDIIALKKDGKWLIYNSRTNAILGQGFDAVRVGWVNKFIEVNANKKWGCIDATGKLRFAPKYDSVGLSSTDYTVVGNEGKFAYTDASGKELFPLKYQMTFGMENGVGFFAINDKAGIINSKGKEIVPAKYDLRKIKISSYSLEMLSGYSFNKGIALVRINGKGGYVDYTGKEYWED